MEYPIRTKNGKSVIECIEHIEKERPDIAEAADKYARELVKRLRGKNEISNDDVPIHDN